MTNSAKKFFTFILSIKTHIITLMSGGAITVGIGIWQYWSRHNVAPVVYIGVIFLFILIACYQTWLNVYQTASVYEELLKPKIKVSFQKDIDPYEELKHISGRPYQTGDYKIIRVKVTNTGGINIYHIKARVDLSIHQTMSFEDFPLTIMGQPPTITSFSLSPGESEFVNVAMRMVHPPGGSTLLCLSGQRHGSNYIGDARREFNLLITGSNIPEHKQLIALEISKGGSLELQLLP
jgi:hypothetical protein